jgi:hypothetical protein
MIFWSATGSSETGAIRRFAVLQSQESPGIGGAGNDFLAVVHDKHTASEAIAKGAGEAQGPAALASWLRLRADIVPVKVRHPPSAETD